MDKRWVIGLSLGTTGDGVDAVLLEIEGVGLQIRVRLVESIFQPHTNDIRTLLRQITGTETSAKQISLVNRLLGETLAICVNKVVNQAGIHLQTVQCVGCPGYTLWHEPEHRYPNTLSIGTMAVVAELTGITTVSDFRSRDLAAGGQGLPLTVLADHIVFRRKGEHRVLVNLGGIASIVWLPGAAEIRETLGFHCGPCNGLLDEFMFVLTRGRECYDAWGKHAVQGRCIEELLQRWIHHPMMQRKPPKGMPKNAFGEEFVRQALEQARVRQWTLHDLLCTATHFVAHGVTEAVKNFLPTRPDRVLLSGGGVRNGLLWRLIEQNLDGIPLSTIESEGIPCRSRKAVGFGCLAALTIDGCPANLPAVTGANGSRLLGSITPGSPQNWAQCLHWMSQQTSLLAAA